MIVFLKISNKFNSFLLKVNLCVTNQFFLLTVRFSFIRIGLYFFKSIETAGVQFAVVEIDI